MFLSRQIGGENEASAHFVAALLGNVHGGVESSQQAKFVRFCRNYVDNGELDD
jgi:hypothetical protein